MQPFRQLPAIGDGRRQRRPLTFWLFLVAYLCATFALAGPRSATLPPLWLVDRSASVEGLSTAAFPGGEVRSLGEDGEVITAFEIMNALQLVQPGRPVTVVTDQLPPTDLPTHITWPSADPSGLFGHGGKILQAIPVDGDSWRVHWALDPGQEAVLRSASWSSGTLQGPSGTTLVPGSELPEILFLEDVHRAVADPDSLDSITLSATVFLLSQDVHPDWEEALLAIWPGSSIRRVSSIRAGGFVTVLHNDQIAPTPDSWLELDLEVSPTPDAIASLAGGWRAWREIHDPAFDRREWVLPYARPQTRWTPGPADTISAQRTPTWLPWMLLLGGCCAATAWFCLAPRSGTQART